MSLTLEVGKSYKSRNGEIFKIIHMLDSDYDCFIGIPKDNTYCTYFYSNGEYLPGRYDYRDLIEEIKEESTSPQTKGICNVSEA